MIMRYLVIAALLILVVLVLLVSQAPVYDGYKQHGWKYPATWYGTFAVAATAIYWKTILRFFCQLCN